MKTQSVMMILGLIFSAQVGADPIGYFEERFVCSLDANNKVMITTKTVDLNTKDLDLIVVSKVNLIEIYNRETKVTERFEPTDLTQCRDRIRQLDWDSRVSSSVYHPGNEKTVPYAAHGRFPEEIAADAAAQGLGAK